MEKGHQRIFLQSGEPPLATNSDGFWLIWSSYRHVPREFFFDWVVSHKVAIFTRLYTEYTKQLVKCSKFRGCACIQNKKSVNRSA